MGKLTFAIDAWGGVGQGHLSKVQKIQDRVSKAAKGPRGDKLSGSQRLQALGWLTVRQEAKLATLRLAHKVIHRGIPEEMAGKMPLNVTNSRLIEAKKLRTKPKYLNKNAQTLSSFRNRAYLINTLPHRLTSIKEPKSFSKWGKEFLKDSTKIPKVIPKKPISRPNIHRKTITYGPPSNMAKISKLNTKS